jgi:aspartate-semialdehyde dehydrogenase
VTKLRACILGATGIVGQHFIRLLSDHPYFEVSGLAASERSKGQQYGEATDWIVSSQIPKQIEDLTLTSLDIAVLQKANYDVFFSALPGDIAFSIEEQLASLGYPIFSNANAHRLLDGVPILIPEINSNHLELIKTQSYDGGYIVTNSNCSTSGLVFGLKPLQDYGIDEVLVTTYQAISGAGRRGVASMDILGNVIPFIRNEEEKIETETRIILGDLSNGVVNPAEFSVNASCARVPVFDGHLESISVKTNNDISVDDAIERFSTFSGIPQEHDLPTAPETPIQVLSEDDRPQPLRDLNLSPSNDGMRVKIGRIRKKGKWLNFFLLVHNTIRGAAGASVLNAEYALAKDYLGSALEVSA